MIEQHARHCYQRYLVNPVASYIGERISANQVTLLSGIFGLLVLPALTLNQVVLAIIMLLLSGFCDTLDGTLARFNNTSSDWGSVLDITMDRLVEWVVVFALWNIAPAERGFWCLLMLGTMLLCITSFLVVGIFSVNHSQKGFHYSPGLMERAEAFFFFILMMLMPAAFGFLAALFSLLVTFTAITRLVQFRNLQQMQTIAKTDELATVLKQDQQL